MKVVNMIDINKFDFQLSDLYLKFISDVETHLKIFLPDSEKKVLSVLIHLKQATAPAIVKSSNNNISLASVYELLKRLTLKKIIISEETYFNLGGVNTRRVIYKINNEILNKDS